MPTGPIAAAAVCARLASLFAPVTEVSTTDAQTTTTAAVATIEPALPRNAHQVLIALFHAILLQLEFRFTGFGSGNSVDSSSGNSSSGSTSVLPSGWATLAEQQGLRYSHQQSQLQFLVKAVSLGDHKLLIHATPLGSGAGKTASLEVSPLEFVSNNVDYTAAGQQSQPPHSTSPQSTVPPPSHHHPSAASQSTSHVTLGAVGEVVKTWFPIQSQLDEIIRRFVRDIVQVITPGLNIKGYSEIAPSGNSGGSGGSAGGAGGGPVRPDFHPIPHRGPSGPHREGGGVVGPFGGVGSTDLDPFAALRDPSAQQGGGMVVGPGHPMFRPRFDEDDPSGVFGGPQPLPRGAIPPGARFDPISPPGIGNLPGVPHPPLGGHRMPDNDEFMPPGFDGGREFTPHGRFPNPRPPRGPGGFGGGLGPRGGGFGGGSSGGFGGGPSMFS